MHRKVKVVFYFLALVFSLVTSVVIASERPVGVSKKIINISDLENVTGHNLTAITVVLEPDVRVPTHIHAGFVFLYVLEGAVRSQLNHGEVVLFTTGQSWVEPPGTIHSLTHNPSTTEKAKILAVFVAKEDSTLTNFEVEH